MPRNDVSSSESGSPCRGFRTRKLCSAILLLALIGVIPTIAPAQQVGSEADVKTSADARISAEQLYRDILPATCWIVVATDDGLATGTGWIVDRDQRLLITNHHVVADQKNRVVADNSLRVFFPCHEDGQLIAGAEHYLDSAEAVRGGVFDTDDRRDLAVIRLDSLPEGAVELPLAPESPDPGETVHSVGHPDSSQALWVYTSGTVRQVHLLTERAPWGPQEFRAVMTQAPTNPGDSGGPVVNDRGELVAVTVSYRNGARLISNCIAASEVVDYLDEVRPLLDPTSAEDFNERGLRYYNKHRLDRAISDYTEAMRHKKRWDVAYGNRGWAFEAKGDYESALADFNQAIQLDPEDVNYLHGRGLVYHGKNEYKKAVADLTTAIRLDPKDAESYDNRADVYYDTDHYDLAIADCNEAIRLDPKVATFWNNRGRAYRGKGMNKQAVADYSQAIALNPEKAIYYYNRARANYSNGAPDLADADFARFERLNPILAQEEKKFYQRKYLKIANHTNETIRVFLTYHTKTTSGQWEWFPGPPDGSNSIGFLFQPGETAQVRHDEFKINADRIRIWAESVDDSGGWPVYREQDLLIAPEEGYNAYFMQDYTHAFLP